MKNRIKLIKLVVSTLWIISFIGGVCDMGKDTASSAEIKVCGEDIRLGSVCEQATSLKQKKDEDVNKNILQAL